MPLPLLSFFPGGTRTYKSTPSMRYARDTLDIFCGWCLCLLPSYECQAQAVCQRARLPLLPLGVTRASWCLNQPHLERRGIYSFQNMPKTPTPQILKHPDHIRKCSEHLPLFLGKAAEVTTLAGCVFQTVKMCVKLKLCFQAAQPPLLGIPTAPMTSNDSHNLLGKVRAGRFPP